MLRMMARAVVWRHRPFVIGITGSIGKTTTKDALFTILRAHTAVRTNIANYNNEFGVPLTVIGAPSGGRSLGGWLRVVVTWLWTMTLQRDYPTVLVLELGIDHVGDMDYLVDMVSPQMGVVTVVHGVHAAKLGTVATIAREKGVLIARLPADGVAVLNADDARVAAMSRRTRAQVWTYSAQGAEHARLRAGGVACTAQGGMTFKVHEGCTTVPVRLPHVVAPQLVPSLMAAIAAARAYGVNLADVAQSLRDFRPPQHRMTIIRGARDVTIIDDTYNAAPPSVRGALAALHMMPTQHKRVAVLGDMRELGDAEVAAHAGLAADIIAREIDEVVCVGPLMRHLYDALVARKSRHAAPNVCHYATTADAADALGRHVAPGDTVLVKGSNGMHMWDVVNALSQHEGIRVDSTCE